MPAPERSHALDHIVVVLFENRSLDNVLGHLYGPGDGKSFDGVIGKDLSNPIPAWAKHGAERKAVPYTVATDLDSLNGIARNFGVFDHWFSEVPSQTFMNRSFWTAATSSGFVVNSPMGKWLAGNEAGTIFDRLEAHGRTWKVYILEPMPVSFTGVIHYPRLKDRLATHFARRLASLRGNLACPGWNVGCESRDGLCGDGRGECCRSTRRDGCC